MTSSIRRVSALMLLCGALWTGGAGASLPDIYPTPGQAHADVAAALRTAAATHRRIIIDFGGNWCPDCHVLDSYFHDDANRALLEANFVLVHVNVGRRDANLDIAEHYSVPLKGVPALAVLDTDGNLLFSQQTGEFASMRSMQSSAVTQFLRQWKLAGSH